jgi:hypothetical protein
MLKNPLTLRRAAIAGATLVAGATMVAAIGIAPASADPTDAQVTKLVILYDSSTIYAGSTHTFTVLGKDANDNTVADETSNVLFSSNYDTDTNPDPKKNTNDQIAGNVITFKVPGTPDKAHLIKAVWPGSVNNLKAETAVSVVPGAQTASISIGAATVNSALGSTHVFAATALDSQGFRRGTVTATYKSSSAHDTVHGNAVHFGAIGTRTVTGSYTYAGKTFKATATVVVKHVFAASLSIDGTFATGRTVHALVHGVSGLKATVTYRWYNGTHPIATATHPTYTLPASTKGASISVKVLIVKSGYFNKALASGLHKVA